MAITTVDDLAAALAAPAQRMNWFKAMSAPKGAGAFQSAWLSGGVPAAGAASPVYTAGSGYTCDKSTTGALAYTNGSAQNWLAQAIAAGGVAGSLIIADRLWSCSGMGFAATTYSVTTPGALPARITDNGLGCELWIEQFVAAGSSSGTMTAAYLDSAGASKSAVLGSVQSAPVIGQMQQIPLANNLGVKQLTSLQNSATWTSGTFGATILKRLATIPFPLIGVGSVQDWLTLGLPQIPSDACLMFILMANGASTPNLYGSLAVIDK